METELLAGDAWDPQSLWSGGLDQIMNGPGVARRRAQVAGWEQARSEDVLEMVAAWARLADQGPTVGAQPTMCTGWAIAFSDHLGRAHRVDGPALVRPCGHREWCTHGTWHRTDGPAVIMADGTCRHLSHGRLHRTDGPAVWSPSGLCEWYLHGVRHRDDGPARISSEHEEWWLAGEQVSREDVLGGGSHSLAETLFV